MSENKQDSDRGPETAFASLRDRPAPELDSHGLWQRIEAQLTPRSSPLWARLFPGAPAPNKKAPILAAMPKHTVATSQGTYCMVS